MDLGCIWFFCNPWLAGQTPVANNQRRRHRWALLPSIVHHSLFPACYSHRRTYTKNNRSVARSSTKANPHRSFLLTSNGGSTYLFTSILKILRTVHGIQSVANAEHSSFRRLNAMIAVIHFVRCSAYYYSSEVGRAHTLIRRTEFNPCHSNSDGLGHRDFSSLYVRISHHGWSMAACSQQWAVVSLIHAAGVQPETWTAASKVYWRIKLHCFIYIPNLLYPPPSFPAPFQVLFRLAKKKKRTITHLEHNHAFVPQSRICPANMPAIELLLLFYCHSSSVEFPEGHSVPGFDDGAIMYHTAARPHRCNSDWGCGGSRHLDGAFQYRTQRHGGFAAADL